MHLKELHRIFSKFFGQWFLFDKIQKWWIPNIWISSHDFSDFAQHQSGKHVFFNQPVIRASCSNKVIWRMKQTSWILRRTCPIHKQALFDIVKHTNVLTFSSYEREWLSCASCLLVLLGVYFRTPSSMVRPRVPDLRIIKVYAGWHNRAQALM